MTAPYLPSGLPITDAQGRPTLAFIRFMQQISSGATSVMPTPSPLAIQCDYTGVILTGELPAQVVVHRFQNGLDVSSQSQWAIAVSSGTITATVGTGNTGGVITITAFASSSAIIQVKSTFRGIPLYCNVTVNKVLASTPTTGGSGGSSGSTSTITSTSSSSYGSANTADLSVVVGSSGTVNLSAPLTVKTDKTAGDGTFKVWGKWQWYNGTSWIDVAAEVQSNPDCAVTTDSDGIHTLSSGTLSVSTSQGGLTAGSTQKFHLMLRNDATTGVRTMNYYGTVSAVPA